MIDMDEDHRRGNGRFFISVLAKIQQSPAYVSLWYNKEIRAFVVRGTTVGWCLLMNDYLDRILKAKHWLVYSRRRLKHWFVVCSVSLIARAQAMLKLCYS